MIGLRIVAVRSRSPVCLHGAAVFKDCIERTMAERIKPSEYYAQPPDQPGGTHETPIPAEKYTSYDQIPRPQPVEIVGFLQRRFADEGQAGQRILQDGLLPENVSGRERTPQAIEYAMQTTLDEATKRQRVWNRKPVVARMRAQGIYTIQDLFAAPASEYTRLMEEYPPFLQGVASAFTHPLLVSPETVFAYAAVYGSPLDAPEFSNDPEGLAHEAAMRRVVEHTVARMDPAFSLMLGLRFLHNGVGMRLAAVRQHFGLRIMSAERARQHEQDAFESLERLGAPIERMRRVELLKLALSPAYEQAVAYVEKVAQDEQAVKLFQERVIAALADLHIYSTQALVLQNRLEALRGIGSELPDDLPFLALRFPNAKDMSLQVRTFNVFIGRLGGVQDQKKIQSVGEVRRGTYPSDLALKLEDIQLAQEMFVKDGD